MGKQLSTSQIIPIQNSVISVEELRNISFLFDNDIFDLTLLLVKACRVKDSRATYNVKSYPTLHGVAGHYAMLFNIDRQVISDLLINKGFDI